MITKSDIYKILFGLLLSAAVTGIGGIYFNTKEYPHLKETTEERFNDNKAQHERFDELFQQEMDKRDKDKAEIERLNDEILILKTKLERKW